MDIGDQREEWRKAHPEYLLPDGTVDIDKLCTQTPSFQSGDLLSPPAPDNQPRKMWVPMSLDAGVVLEQLAVDQAITLVEALRRAIATEAYIREEVAKGSKVLLLTADGEVREVFYR